MLAFRLKIKLTRLQPVVDEYWYCRARADWWQGSSLILQACTPLFWGSLVAKKPAGRQ